MMQRKNPEDVKLKLIDMDKEALFRISRVDNGFILACNAGTYIAKDKKELTALIGKCFDDIIPKENETSVQFKVVIDD